MPPPLRLRSNHAKGMQKPCNKNCVAGKVSSSLVSDIMSISILLLTIVDRCSNLFLIELILSWPLMRRFMLFIIKSFRRDCGSFSSLLFQIIIRTELDEEFPVLRVAFNGFLLFWVTISSPFEKHQNLQSLINLLKLLVKMPCPFLFGCNLSGNKFSLLFMLVCWIIAKFSAMHFSCRCMSTFFGFSDNLSARGTRDETATSITLVFKLFANCIISRAISDGILFLSRLFLCVKQSYRVFVPWMVWCNLSRLLSLLLEMIYNTKTFIKWVI